jgi:hypothetical protein
VKTFRQFVSEVNTGGIPNKPYVPPSGPSQPTQPPEGFDKFREKYGLPPRQAQMVPSKTQTPLDLRTPAQKLLQLQQLRKQNPSA